jgi:hypothetical protein
MVLFLRGQMDVYTYQATAAAADTTACPPPGVPWVLPLRHALQGEHMARARRIFWISHACVRLFPCTHKSIEKIQIKIVDRKIQETLGSGG